MKKAILLIASLIALFFLFGKGKPEVENFETSKSIHIDQKNIEAKSVESDVEDVGVKAKTIQYQPNARFEKKGIFHAQQQNKHENKELTELTGHFSISNTLREIEEKNGLNPDIEFNWLEEPKPDIWTRSITFPFRDDKNDIEINLIWDKESDTLASSSCFYSKTTGKKMYKNGDLHLKMGSFGYAVLFLKPNCYVRFKPSHTHDFDLPGKIFTRTATEWKEVEKFMAQELLVGTSLRLKHCSHYDADE